LVTPSPLTSLLLLEVGVVVEVIVQTHIAVAEVERVDIEHRQEHQGVVHPQNPH
jgi:hypothetical protein